MMRSTYSPLEVSLPDLEDSEPPALPTRRVGPGIRQPRGGNRVRYRTRLDLRGRLPVGDPVTTTAMLDVGNGIVKTFKIPAQVQRVVPNQRKRMERRALLLMFPEVKTHKGRVKALRRRVRDERRARRNAGGEG